MKQISLIISFFIFNLSYGQVDNYDLLTKNIEFSNIKSITKYIESKKFPNGQKEFKLEFNNQGKLLSIDEFEYPTGPENPMVMRQLLKYDQTGKKIANYIKAPEGSIAIDTFIYNNKGDLIKQQRIINGEIVRTWDYTNKKKVEVKKEFDNKQNLIKLTKFEGNYILYQYDSTGNMTQEIQFQEGKEYQKYTYQYDKNERLIKLNVYLLYAATGLTGEPLTYYFEYE